MANTKIMLRDNLFSHKLTIEYSCIQQSFASSSNYVEVLIDAYKMATSLFDPACDNSIVEQTLEYYMNQIDHALDSFTENLDAFPAISEMMSYILRLQKMKSNGPTAFKETLASELYLHPCYYGFFDLDYYLEKARTYGLNPALKELEDDVNTRANTYFKAAYHNYLELLPGFSSVMKIEDDK